MKKFVRRESLKHLREVLTRTDDELECQRIVKMIEAEETRQREEK